MVDITGGFVQIVHRVLRRIHLAALCSGAVSSTLAVPGRLFQDSAISNENYELPRTAISSQRHLHYSTSTFFQDNTIFNENYEPPRTAICPHRQRRAPIRMMNIITNSNSSRVYQEMKQPFIKHIYQKNCLLSSSHSFCFIYNH